MMDFSGVNHPRSGLGYGEPPEVNTINRLHANGGGSEHGTSTGHAGNNGCLEPQAPRQVPIKITPPPPRFVQATIPSVKPLPFTVLGSSKSHFLQI